MFLIDPYYRKGFMRYTYYGKLFLNLIFLLAVCIPIGLNIREYYEAVYNETGNHGIQLNEVTQVSYETVDDMT